MERNSPLNGRDPAYGKRRSLATTTVLAVLTINCLLRCAPAREPGLYAVLETAKGDIVLRLEYQKVPMTVTNFVGLAEGTIKNSARAEGEPFYDGLTFHRVVPNFMVQGGDPKGTGRGDPGYRFPDEFHPELRHGGPGVLSMANSGPGTNGSQFFITHTATPHLNDKHSVFGRVVEGQNVVDSIQQGDKIKRVRIERFGKEAKEFRPDQKSFKNLQKKAKATEQSRMENLIRQKWPQAQQTASGLWYVVTAEGSGPKPQKGTTVTAHYTGTLLDGRKFDSSVDRGRPFKFPVGAKRVIAGWDEAFLDMAKGEKRTLIIPPDLAYGKRGHPPVIPPNSYLVFDVELIDF
jgi:peptidylprolyl isomerase